MHLEIKPAVRRYWIEREGFWGLSQVNLNTFVDTILLVEPYGSDSWMGNDVWHGVNENFLYGIWQILVEFGT